MLLYLPDAVSHVLHHPYSFAVNKKGRTCPKKIVFRRRYKISVNTPFHVTFTVDEL